MKLHLLLVIPALVFLNCMQAQNPEQRLAEMGIELSVPNEPAANFVRWRRVGNTLYLAGTGSAIKGKLEKDLSNEEGYQASRQTGITILGVLKAACGDLDKIKQFVKVRGMVNSTPEFIDQPKVINGFSDLMVQVFWRKRKACPRCSRPRELTFQYCSGNRSHR